MSAYVVVGGIGLDIDGEGDGRNARVYLFADGPGIVRCECGETWRTHGRGRRIYRTDYEWIIDGAAVIGVECAYCGKRYEA